MERRSVMGTKAALIEALALIEKCHAIGQPLRGCEARLHLLRRRSPRAFKKFCEAYREARREFMLTWATAIFGQCRHF